MGYAAQCKSSVLLWCCMLWRVLQILGKLIDGPKITDLGFRVELTHVHFVYPALAKGTNFF
jgi:hypothetical protein